MVPESQKADRFFLRFPFMKFPFVLLPVAMGLAVALYSLVRFDGDAAFYRLWYYVPAAMVVGCLAADRLFVRRPHGPGWAIDGLVTAICLSRPIFGWPPVSGHALFFVYVLMTCKSLTARASAAVLGIITLYAKIWLWHWDSTLWPGLILGLIVGWVFLRTQRLQT